MGGFGFIMCEETFMIFGRDVYVHQSNRSDFEAGDDVAFKVQIDLENGSPQAHDLKSPMKVEKESTQAQEVGTTGISMIGMMGMTSIMGMDPSMMAGMCGFSGLTD